MSPTIHPRYFIVAKAENEISTDTLKIVEKYELTYGEIVRILSHELSSFARFMIREERHPNDPDKKGDEA